VGDPFLGTGYGTFHEPIAQLLDRYLPGEAVDLTPLIHAEWERLRVRRTERLAASTPDDKHHDHDQIRNEEAEEKEDEERKETKEGMSAGMRKVCCLGECSEKAHRLVDLDIQELERLPPEDAIDTAREEVVLVALCNKLCECLDDGRPVVVWMTLDLQPLRKDVETWIDCASVATTPRPIDPSNDSDKKGEDTEEEEKEVVVWHSPEHCALLVGYEAKGALVHSFLVNDPHTGRRERYPARLFLERWAALGCQAVTTSPSLKQTN